MSRAAEAWLALPVPKRRYYSGAQVGGLPNLCVLHVACSHCKAKPGQLCRGSSGPTLCHHSARGYAFLRYKRAHPAAFQRASRSAALEERLLRIERLLGRLQDAVGRIQPAPHS